MRRSRKPFTPSGVRGFESLPLRHLKVRAGAVGRLPFLMSRESPQVYTAHIWRSCGAECPRYEFLWSAATASTAPRAMPDSYVLAGCPRGVKLVSGRTRNLWDGVGRVEAEAIASVGTALVDLGTQSQVTDGHIRNSCDTIPNRMLPALDANLHDPGPSAQRR